MGPKMFPETSQLFSYICQVEWTQKEVYCFFNFILSSEIHNETMIKSKNVMVPYQALSVVHALF